MALGIIQDPNSLSQGYSTAVADGVFQNKSGANIEIASSGADLPVLAAGEFFEVRDHSETVNNGLYIATGTPTASLLACTKVSGSQPINATTEAIAVLASLTSAVTDMVLSGQSGRSVHVASAGGELPVLVAGSRFVISAHSDADNNGTYEVTSVVTSTEEYICTKLDTSTAEPNNGASEAAVTTSDHKSVMYDTAAREIYLLEKGGLDLDGALGQAFYSFTMISWKTDDYLIAAAPFPMLCIDSDAGKYFIGQDPSGNNNGWAFKDVASPAIRTRKLLRNMGWAEIADDASTSYVYAGIRTLGAFLDQTPTTGDKAYYQFGADTTVDDTVSFTFCGPVAEAICCYDGLVTPIDAAVGFVITLTNTITRADGGNWYDDGYKVGGQITITDAEDAGNVGTFTLVTVADGVNGAVVVDGVLTNNAADTVMKCCVDNRNALTLRLRMRTTAGNSNARTFAQSNLAAAGETVLSNRLFTFGLSNAQDLDISATDNTIDTTLPYTGMTLTYYATPQSLGGSGLLVGGPYNFGIVIDGNGGTNTQVYEWTQRQLRKNTDIDAGGDTGIGLTLDGLMRFLGPTLQVGSVDGGLTFPVNPVGGGSGVFITDLNAASKNDTVYYDNTGTVRSHPLSVSVTLDFNQTLIDDTAAEYWLFFDRTIRSTVSDLVVTAGTGPSGTFDSTGGNLPATLNKGAGAYVRIAGLTGVDEPMNGVYQVTTLTSTSQWDVTRYDGETIVTASSTSCTLDQNCVDTPDAIIVQDDVAAPVTGAASADYAFSYDYSGNVQGGHTGGTDAYVVARAIGQEDAQYTQSTVQTISTSAVTIPLASNIERNFSNP